MDKKELKRKYQEEQLRLFRESLPIPETEFPALFDYLDEAFEEFECEDNLSLVEKYCKEKNLDFEKLAEWCEEYGGYCDCEVLANLEDHFEYLQEPPSIPLKKQSQIQKQKLDQLTTDTFSIQQIPAPWTLTELKENQKTSYQFRIGKKSDLSTDLVFDFPVDKLSCDDYLHLYWEENTDLICPDLIIEREIIGNYQIVQISSPSWIPVRIFVFTMIKPTWCLIMKTESQRKKGDRKELEKLIQMIK